MIARVRASFAPVLVLLVACSASAAAQPNVALIKIVGRRNDLGREVRARMGDGPAKIVVLKRIEPDSTLSRVVLALPSGMVGIEESLEEAVRRLRFPPAFRDGCPMAVWYPSIFEQNTVGAAGGERVGSFEVDVGRDFFTGVYEGSAAITPRGATRREMRGHLMWSCAEGGGLWVGVALSGEEARDGETRPVEWRFDGDTPATGSLRGVRGFRRWFLPAEDVARFTVRAGTARSLVIRLPDGGTEYAYELEQPREALDRLACARGTPMAGRLPQPSMEEFRGVGKAVGKP